MKVATRVWATLAIALVWIAVSVTVASGPTTAQVTAPKVSGVAATCLRP